ncbi:prepilin-type N-terminal cleavage/methylation domain-containing protein [Nautilia lithotrophica]
MTKQKKLNNFSSAFTLIELLVVIIIIGIIVATLSFNFSPNRLQLAADQLIKDIKFTQSLALKDDKYQPFPKTTSTSDQNQSKYWFKQWWHLKITNTGNTIYYYIFSDSPSNASSSNFDEGYSHLSELAINPLSKKYYIGALVADYSPELNLSSYGIKRIEFTGYSSSNMPTSLGNRIDILFDNLGNVYLNEGTAGDAGDINPFANVRKLLTRNVKIKLCKDTTCSNNNCIAIEISPSGNVEEVDCN